MLQRKDPEALAGALGAGTLQARCAVDIRETLRIKRRAVFGASVTSSRLTASAPEPSSSWSMNSTACTGLETTSTRGSKRTLGLILSS